MTCFHLFIAAILVFTASAHGETQNAIVSGVAWHDQNLNPVSAHGGGILKEGEKFYFFGEYKKDHGNEFSGYSCYSSPDLVHWKFESMALPVQKNGKLAPDRVGERPKVLKCPKTGEFIMFMHTDDSNYKDQAVGYATSPTVNGTYTFKGPILFDGKPIKKWDMSVYQDDDGTGYLITHSGNLFRLADDFKSVKEQIVKDMTHGCEAPAIFKRSGTYYWVGSGLSAWERNDNYYFTASSLEGPWTKQGLLAPEGTLTWNSQSTFILPIVGSETTTYLFMGDRWAHPRQHSAATYVWQPLQFDKEGKMSLPKYHPSWKVDTKTGQWSDVELEGKVTPISEFPGVQKSDGWQAYTDAAGLTDMRSKVKGDTLTIPFTGTRIGLHGVARPDGGFGQVEIKDSEGQVVLTTIMETYCLYGEASLKFLSPELKRGDYTLTVTVLGERFHWQAKKATYGSSDDFVSVQKVLLID